ARPRAGGGTRSCRPRRSGATCANGSRRPPLCGRSGEGGVQRGSLAWALHGRTTRLYLVTDVASGVLNGTEVWLAGKKVGLVRSVELRPPATDTAERIAIAMDVLDPYVRYIRRNSDVRIQPGGRLIGAPVVYIDVGTAAAP